VSQRDLTKMGIESSIAGNACRLGSLLEDHFGTEASTAGEIVRLAWQLASRQEFYILFDRIVAAKMRVNRFANQPRRKTRKRAHGT